MTRSWVTDPPLGILVRLAAKPVALEQPALRSRVAAGAMNSVCCIRVCAYGDL